MTKTITVEAVVHAPLEKVWGCWIDPSHIVQWNHASPDWECPWAENEVMVGKTFKWRMQAKDKSFGFDFEGTYTSIVKHHLIEYSIADGRRVSVQFSAVENGTKVVETFEMENENSEEMQRLGWQAILDNFKKHTEGTQ